MNSITSAGMIDSTQHIFSMHRLPKTIVTDNDRSFISDEFQHFCRMNVIQYITSSP